MYDAGRGCPFKYHSNSPGAGKDRDPRTDNVASARHSVTLVTSLWANGECGPLTIVLPLGFLSDDERLELQDKFKPDVYLMTSGRASHFMNSDVVVDYFETVLADAFERRRCVLSERYGRSFQDEKGFILCDSFTGHHSTSAGSDIQRS